MKSESFQKMMLRYIIVFGLVSLTLAQSSANANKSIKKPSDIKHMKSASASSIDLKKQQFQSTKERPGLDRALSELINEDIKKSIDAKRHAEYDLSPLAEASTAPQPTTVAPVQTTVKYIPKAQDDSDVMDSIAGSSSEKKQTSRIEIKKGPNGIDYEYEYVYYYYDDDDKDSKKSAAASDDKSIGSQNGGKNRYDKSSTTPKPSFDHNELPTSRGKGRQSIPVIEETSEERLPVNTRFPPRSAVTPTVQVLSNIDETTKKISVKRPSLELVDSQSFNRGEKGQSKGSRVLENEFAKANDVKASENLNLSPTIMPSVTEFAPQNIASNEVTTAASDSDETTTQIMDKVALDLYAHLVNENSNIDLSTGAPVYEDTTGTYGPTSTTEEYTTVEATTSTTTTTTEAATTTSTTTTTEAPILINGRRSPFGAGRRNPLKSRSKPTESKVEEPKESASSESAQAKPKNRFSRPSFNARSRPTPTVAATPTSGEEEKSVEHKAKPVAAAANRGRTRNRFNLRSSTPVSVASEEKNPDENAIDTSAQITSTQRSLRTRPTFNLRGRSRVTPSSTAAPSADAAEPADVKFESEEKSATSVSPLKSSSRFNLRRPNQLLSPRGRTSPFAKAPAPSAEQSAEASNSTDAANSTTPLELSKESADESEQIAAEPSTTPQTGINRLRNRPRIQIQPKAASTNKQPTAASYINANRKVNPLISRRKIGSSSTTEEAPVTEDNEASDDLKDSQSESKEGADNEGNAKEEAPATLVEASSEQPRGLGLLANRRRPARRPGSLY